MPNFGHVNEYGTMYIHDGSCKFCINLIAFWESDSLSNVIKKKLKDKL